ncbi:hypothetical protein LTR62_002262 [Meristemomyces frigidus]|uniref:Uncharacterized protein n=1 Tax=Meristemomyces frigidus TaxID=1508187 RepID=A0AAN7TT47_9PEZI|nr:hypothetical protein LTR62_002262 [Meristemomyces frigidus]
MAPHVRVLRPWLSLRRQVLARAQSTSTSPRLTPSTFLRRNRAPLIFGTLALALGLMAGNLTAFTIAPPPMPNAGTHEDGVLMADLNQRLDNEFKVKVLRGKCLGVAKQLKGTQGGWVEIVQRPSDEELAARTDSIISHLQGAKALGPERVFWDTGERRLVAIVWFGGAISGWPGVTHGGAIATALAEKAALAATLAQSTTAGFSAAATPQRMPGTGNHAKMFAPATEQHGDPAQLSLSYVKPTLANNFYVIRVSSPMDFEHEEPEGIVPLSPAGGEDYEVTLEAMDTKVCVKAKVKFAPGGGALQHVEEKVGEAARKGYGEFRDWMWPSRQQSSRGG